MTERSHHTAPIRRPPVGARVPLSLATRMPAAPVRRRHGAASLHGAQDARMVAAVCATIGVAILALGAELIGLPLPFWP